MDIRKISVGKNVPEDVHVIIENCEGGQNIKYEFDKDSGAIEVDRFSPTAMGFPCNYGFIPHTLAGDGDPVDALVVAPVQIQVGTFLRCRPVGVLITEDESGQDEKLLMVPIKKLTKVYDKIESYTDFPEIFLQKIVHFYEHYKDLEPGKWVKVTGWKDAETAKNLIMEGAARYQKDKTSQAA